MLISCAYINIDMKIFFSLLPNQMLPFLFHAANSTSTDPEDSGKPKGSEQIPLNQ